MATPEPTPDTPTMTFEEYCVEVHNLLKLFPFWRRGQAAFNTLNRVRPDLVDEIHTSKLDPFHRDDRLPEFYTWVKENW